MSASKKRRSIARSQQDACFDQELNGLRARLVEELRANFLRMDGKVDWRAILELNSGGKGEPE